MDWIAGLGIFLVVYAALCFIVAFLKPAWVWRTGKLQGFVDLIGETGTVIMLTVVGAACLAGGLALLF